MKKLAENKLLAGFIYGDPVNREYLYLPGSEVDSEEPVLVYEKDSTREDLTMEEGLTVIERRSLKPCSHPVFGHNTMS